MLSTTPRVAVLLAAYNGMQWIEEQLSTIQQQQGVRVHILISVDPSTDGTDQWCSAYGAQHANVTLTPPLERCGGAARNFFHLIDKVDLSGFDYIAFADQDDHWHLDKLKRATLFLSENPVDAYSSNVVAFWPDGHRQLLDKAQPQVTWDHFFEAAGPGCTYVLKQGLANYVQQEIRAHWGAVQAVTLHDWFIYAMARAQGYRWYIDPIPGMDYRQHLQNQVGANVGMSALVARFRTIRSGWWFGQVRLIENLVNHDKPPTERPRWRQLGRLQLIGLACAARRCRRRSRDQWLFRLLSVLSAVLGANVQ